MENKFYNELSKFKKAEKVELANVKNLASINKEVKSFISKNESKIKEFSRLKKEIKELSKDTEKLVREFRPIKTDVFQQAKALGIVPKDIAEYKEAQGLDSDLSDLWNLISNALR